ncbi:unnamed protein product, partial [Rotaria magnacalcarata]
NISANANWAQNGVTVAGGSGAGGANNQLNQPYGLVVNDDQTLVIVDHMNHRIMQWKNGNTTNGQVVAGDNGAGNGLNQLNYPTDVLIDKETDSLIICDWGNGRVVRWSRRSGTTQGELLIDSLQCSGLAMGEQRYLYVSDWYTNEVRQYQGCDKIGILVAGGATQGTVIAGGNGQGAGANQFNYPFGLGFDQHGNLYVTDYGNHRVQRFSIE